jgi:adenylate cyclase
MDPSKEQKSIPTQESGAAQGGLERKLEERTAELKESLEQQTAIAEVLHMILRSPADVKPVLDAVAVRAARICDASDARMFMVDGDSIRHTAGFGNVPVTRELLPLNRGSASGRAVIDCATVHIEDSLALDANDFPVSLENAKRSGFRTVLAVPLMREDRALGSILLRRRDVRLFSDMQVSLLKTFADQAAIAIEVARQAEELRAWNAKLEERVRSQVSQLEQLSKLKRFVSPRVSAMILAGEVDDPLKTRRREITVVFTDLRGFTAFTETAEPEEVMSVLRDYHGALGRIILAHEGTVEHFAGDGVMILFNDPVPVPGHGLAAVRMALEMRDAVGILAAAWKKRGYALGFGVGVANGYATMGAIGFEGRRDYGAIGTVCNLAARLCGEAKAGQILISQRVCGEVEQEFQVDNAGELALKGFHRPVPAYDVLRAK